MASEPYSEGWPVRFGNGTCSPKRSRVASGNPINVIPLAPGQFDDTPSTISMSRLAAVSATNYGACRANAQQLTDLQAWIREQQAVELTVGD